MRFGPCAFAVSSACFRVAAVLTSSTSCSCFPTLRPNAAALVSPGQDVTVRYTIDRERALYRTNTLRQSIETPSMVSLKRLPLALPLYASRWPRSHSYRSRDSSVTSTTAECFSVMCTSLMRTEPRGAAGVMGLLGRLHRHGQCSSICQPRGQTGHRGVACALVGFLFVGFARETSREHVKQRVELLQLGLEHALFLDVVVLASLVQVAVLDRGCGFLLRFG